jgi:hypothetical protein
LRRLPRTGGDAHYDGAESTLYASFTTPTYPSNILPPLFHLPSTSLFHTSHIIPHICLHARCTMSSPLREIVLQTQLQIVDVQQLHLLSYVSSQLSTRRHVAPSRAPSKYPDSTGLRYSSISLQPPSATVPWALAAHKACSTHAPANRQQCFGGGGGGGNNYGRGSARKDEGGSHSAFIPALQQLAEIWRPREGSL